MSKPNLRKRSFPTGLGAWFFAILLYAAFMSFAVAADADHRDTYFVQLEIDDIGLVQRGLMQATLRTAPAGQTCLRAWNAWTAVEVGGNQRSSTRLDPEGRKDGPINALMESGFDTCLDAGGRIRVSPVDAGAFARVQALLVDKDIPFSLDELAAMRPMSLPVSAQVGQIVTSKVLLGKLGELALEQKIEALGPRLSQVRIEGRMDSGVHIVGRQISLRENGMPVEAYLSITIPEGIVSSSPDRKHIRVYLTSLSENWAPTVNLDSPMRMSYWRNEYVSLLKAGDPADVDPEQLDSAMTAEDLIARLGIRPLPGAGEIDAWVGGLRLRREAGSGMIRVEAATQEHAPVGRVFPRIHLRELQLLDARGRPLRDVEVVPNRVFETWLSNPYRSIDYHDDRFPFRVRNTQLAAVLGQLRTLRLELEFEGYEPAARYRMSADQTESVSPLGRWQRRGPFLFMESAVIFDRDREQLRNDCYWPALKFFNVDGVEVPTSLVVDMTGKRQYLDPEIPPLTNAQWFSSYDGYAVARVPIETVELQCYRAVRVSRRVDLRLQDAKP